MNGSLLRRAIALVIAANVLSVLGLSSRLFGIPPAWGLWWAASFASALGAATVAERTNGNEGSRRAIMVLKTVFVVFVIIWCGCFVTFAVVSKLTVISGTEVIFERKEAYFVHNHGKYYEVPRWRYLIVGTCSAVAMHLAPAGAGILVLIRSLSGRWW